MNQLGRRAREINEANGWQIKPWDVAEDSKNIAVCVALIHSEASEALEAYRDNNKKQFAEELADIIIRTLDLAAFLEIDLDEEVSTKLKKNETRGFRHGGKRV